MLRGIEKRQEVDPSLLLRDTRTLGQRLRDFFHEPAYVTAMLVALAGCAFFVSAISDVILLFGLGCAIYALTRHITLPFRMPKRANCLDYNDLIPGTLKAKKASGISFFGNDSKTNEELWFHNEDMRTHVLMFGSTGSGKTEALISLAYNSLLQGSGFIYVDGKGDNTLYAKVFSMARSVGREDDILLINFMTGARDIVGPQETRLSNTLNPFATGSSSMLSQLVISLMDSSSASPDGDMWKGRAISFVEALMKILVYARDEDYILLDANSIRNYFKLERLEAIGVDRVLIRDNQEPVSLENAPEVVLEPIRHYLDNLPGFNKEKKGKQVSQVLEQHGFITMQLTRAFTSLADTYGHILRTKLAEVDFKDVVLNRRILIVLLPALEKSPDELSNLGKIIVSSLKAMMAAGLGEEVEGEYQDIVQRKPTNAPTPYLCILDEYGYYAVEGFAVVPAQARSLGFSAIFAGQDLPAFQKVSKEEAASIGANTNIKICMKLEDPIETWEFFMKTAGEAYVTKVDAFQTKETSVTNNYLDTKSASFEKRARVDLLDLKDQGLGEAHIFFKSNIIRARLFYANPKLVKRMRLNHFLKVGEPSEQVLLELQKRSNRFQKILRQGDIVLQVPLENEEITLVVEALAANKGLAPIEQGIAALLAYHKHQTPEVIEEIPDTTPLDELNVFTAMRLPEQLKSLLLEKDIESFSQVLIDKNSTRTAIATLEKVSGKLDKQANNIATEIIKDMQTATVYPPVYKDHISVQELTGIAHEAIQLLQIARQKALAKEGQNT